MLKKLSSIKDSDASSLPFYIYARLIRTMKNTTKADKYARLIANVVKLVRTATPQSKSRFAKVYKQLLVLRQIFRWQGLYQAIAQIKEKGWKLFELSNLPNIAYILFEMFADFLDRMIFVIELLDLPYKDFFNKIQQMESDCYFIQCASWLIFYLRTLRQTWREGTYAKKKTYVLKIMKYFLDSLTSYCKFSRRFWQLDPKHAAILGITSSCIGLYELMQ